MKIHILNDKQRLVDGRLVDIDVAKSLLDTFRMKHPWLPEDVFIDLTAGVEPKIEETEDAYVIQAGYYGEGHFSAKATIKKREESEKP